MSGSSEIHRDTFRIPYDMERIPRGLTRHINGTRYVWTGKKWKPLSEKRANPDRRGGGRDDEGQ